ncbi:hypothetical protein HS960_05850 [Sphingobacterium paramultivorum]|jgi:NAD(P)H-hydrate epimerase|uniref:YjeF C-terminal domain-containing protein n=1 Tax=Sphingobacterium paramultivorum TaxID=2886510 RepID=A0A7G5DZN4_9SPHI|nr:hypothetical protein HS960_05850 [Sphingobacterium paramultivorum]
MIASNKKLLDEISPETIITPHIAEFDRLFGEHQNNDERINTALEKSKESMIITDIIKNFGNGFKKIRT